jgi:septal ring factor EnvC (AmiA/AmiB activator)
MDVETATALQGLGFRLDRVELGLADVRTELAEVKTDVASLKTDVASLKTDVASLKTDVASLKTDVASLKTDVGGLKNDIADLRVGQVHLRTELTAQIEESRRHSQMLFESLRGDIQLLAEGFGHLSARFDELRR